MKKNVIIASLIGLIVINVIADYYEDTVEEKLEIQRVKAENRLKKAKESKLINPLVNQLFNTYVKYWSDQDFNKISEEIYGLPFTLYNQDEITVLSTQDQVLSFLKNTFKFGLLIFFAFSKVPSGELSSTNIISTLFKYLKILFMVSSITKASLYVDSIIDTFLFIIFF